MNRLIPLLMAAVFMALSTPTRAEKSFTWEAGLGLANLSFPAYRGAKDRRDWLLPLPTFSVTSRDFNIGRGGAKLALNKSQRWQLRLSANGSLPVNSDDLAIRSGMPDLNSSVELGPALEWQAYQGEAWQFHPELLVRSVIASDFRQFDAIGWVAQARLRWRYQRELDAKRSVEWRLASGPVIASRQYHHYFYSVEPQFARPGRPAYSAAGGYSGWRSHLSLAVLHGRLGLYGFLAHDALDQAQFSDSPLVQTRDYWLAGLMLNWRFFGPRTQTF